MTVVEERIDQLIDTIKKSDDYINYEAAKAQIKQYPEKEQAVNAYRRRNFEFQMKDHSECRMEDADALAEEYKNLSKDALIERYLAAELAMCRLMQRINYQIVTELDFELGF